MEKNSSNYDILDKIIANNKKSKSWTILCVILLCILSGIVLKMYFDISEKKKIITQNNTTINQQNLVIEKLDDFLKIQNYSIDTLAAKYDTILNKKLEEIIGEIVQARLKPKETDLTRANKLANETTIEVNDLIASIKKATKVLFDQYKKSDNITQIDSLSTNK